MSSISSIGSSNSMMMQGMNGMRGMRQRPDPAEMAVNLFSQLDTSGQGYIQKSDLQAAFDKVSSSTSTSTSASSNVDDLFAKLDTDSDGKVTRQEFSDTLKKLHDDFEQQFQDNRMQIAMQAGGMGGMNGMGGMPPPPLRGGNDQGFTKDELSSQLEEIGSSDSERSSLISSTIQNFDAADTNGDGKVSFQEAMAFQQSSSNSSSSGSTTSSSAASSTSSSSSSDNSEAKVMMQIMKLMQVYMTNNSSNAETTPFLSVTA